MDGIPVTLGGKQWVIHLVTRKEMPRRTWGDCCNKTNTIRVRKDLSQVNFLDTLLHEMRHALHEVNYHAEEWINETSTELAVAILATRTVEVKRGKKKR